MASLPNPGQSCQKEKKKELILADEKAEVVTRVRANSSQLLDVKYLSFLFSLLCAAVGKGGQRKRKRKGKRPRLLA